MKKIFTLIAAVMMAVGSNADIKPYFFTADQGQTPEDVAKSEVNITIKDGDATVFTFKATDTNSTSKLKFKASSAKFTADGTTYQQATHRVENGGAVKDKRVWSFTPEVSGKIYLAARTSGAGKTASITVKAGDTAVLDAVTIDDNNTKSMGGGETPYTVYQCPAAFNVTAGTEYTITTDNSIYLHGFYYDDTTTAINNVNATAAKKTAKYVKNGQLVIESANGTFTAAGARVE